MKADPMNRYQKYSALADEYLKLGKEIDRGNPRLYLSQAQIVFNTPEAFGGGKKAAKPLIEEAIKRFDAFKPKTEISPNWGSKAAQQLWDLVNK